jgi:SAM-dependent methyltransferase
MSTLGWKQIWEARQRTSDNTSLEALIRLDGFDSEASHITAAGWQTYADTVASNLGLKAGHSVYEVGCGAGAFLFALKNSKVLAGKLRAIAGLDYSSPLIDVARAVIPEGQFECIEAICLDPLESFDIVVANSVFQYFPREYAFEVLKKMCAKANLGVAVLELPDIQMREESEAFRRGALGQEDYDKKYSNLPHTYYDRSWISSLADAVGMECVFFQQCIPNYAQNPYRFNAILTKNPWDTHCRSRLG